jgi:hypothetical protein
MRRTFLLVLLLFPAGLAAQRPLSPRALAGCYELALERWTPALPDPRYHTPPARVVLDTVPAAGRLAGGAFQVRPAPGTPPGPHEDASWAPLPASPDSLRILWRTGAWGVEMRLRAEGSTLRGQAVAFTDETPERAAARVVARRLEGCAGPAAAAPAAPEVQGTPSPPGRAETITAWTLGGLVAWILLQFTGIL